MSKTHDPDAFRALGQSVGDIVAQKNAQYGDSFAKSGKILEILYPDGIRSDQYRDMLAVTRIVDKLFRVATRHPYDSESPGLDIAGYGVLIAHNHALDGRRADRAKADALVGDLAAAVAGMQGPDEAEGPSNGNPQKTGEPEPITLSD